MGALTLAALCKELEAMGCAHAIDKAAQVLTKIEPEYEAVWYALLAELERRAG